MSCCRTSRFFMRLRILRPFRALPVRLGVMTDSPFSRQIKSLIFWSAKLDSQKFLNFLAAVD